MISIVTWTFLQFTEDVRGGRTIQAEELEQIDRNNGKWNKIDCLLLTLSTGKIKS